MIGTPDINLSLESTFKFVDMVGNIGSKIGGCTILFGKRAINIITKSGGPEQPLFNRFVILHLFALRRRKGSQVDQVIGFQLLNQGSNLARFVQSLLREEMIKLNAQYRKIIPDHLHHLLNRVINHDWPCFPVMIHSIQIFE